jgi:hypothetical protein
MAALEDVRRRFFSARSQFEDVSELILVGLMNDPHDKLVDTLLREAFDGPVADAGFCDRVMPLVPRRRRIVWPLVVGMIVGAGLCWYYLLSSPLLHIDWRDWPKGEPGPAAIAVLLTMAGISLLALGWTSAEADDH